jgi:hypothetical protein
MKWLVAILSFATGHLVLAVAKSSSATVATNQLCGCKAQHCNISYGDCIIATVAASQVVSVAKLSIATFAAVTTNHVAVAKQPTKSSRLPQPFCNRRNHGNWSIIQTLIYLDLSERKKM